MSTSENDDCGDQSSGVFAQSTLRDSIELAFGRFGRFIYGNAWWTIACVSVCVAALCSQLQYVEFDTSTDNFLRKDDPVRLRYDDFRNRFGPDQAILVAVETDDVFDLDFLERLRALHREIESEVPSLDDVTSLINARSTRGEGDELIVEDLLEDWPQSPQELAVIRERVRSNPLYVDQLLSRDERLTTILIKPNVYSSLGGLDDELAGFEDAARPAEQASFESQEAELTFLSGEENTEIVQAIEAIVERHQAEGFRIIMAGMPVMADRIMRVMAEDMARFTGMALATIALCLGLLLRRFSAVLLPLLVSGLAMLSTISFMSVIGVKISTTTQIMPSFLLAVGVGSAVHILSIFYQAIARGEDKEEAVVHALQHSGLAVFLTSFTTAAGMLSFMSANIAPVVELGIVTPIGIMASLALSLVLLPALIAVFPMSEAREKKKQERFRSEGKRLSTAQRLLVTCGDAATAHPWKVVMGWTLLLVFCVVGATRLEVSHDPVSWFGERDPLRMAMEQLNRDLNGSMFVEAVVETGREGGVQTPELLNRLERMREHAAGLREGEIFIGKVISIADVAKETHKALNENGAEFYVIPQDQELLAQELLLFENSGSDDLEDLVDSQFKTARFTMKMPMLDAVHYDSFLGRLERDFSEILDGVASVNLTGNSCIMAHLITILSYNLLKTYLLAFVLITPLMMLLLGSVRMGLLSMLPNLAPIIVTLGLMGWLGIPLEVFTILIGSIALGLAVDDTIHFMHNFRRYFEHGQDARQAVRSTLATTGQALLFTSVVVSSGFFIFMLASMSNLFFFGFLTGVTVIVAFLADLILAPALITLYAGYVVAKRTGAVTIGEGPVVEYELRDGATS